MSIVLQGSTSGSITLQEPAIAGSNTISLPAATGTAVLTGVSGTVDINAAGSNNVTLSTNSTERVRVDSSGNVGIGTTSPDTRLDIVSANNTETTNVLRVSANNETARINIGYNFIDGDNDSGTGRLIFMTESAERMRITSGGELLIGRTSTLNARLGITSSSGACSINCGDETDPSFYGIAQIVRSANQPDTKFHLAFIRGGNRIAGMGFLQNSNTFAIQNPGIGNNSGSGVTLAGDATSWGTTSDERKKDILGNVEDALTKLADWRSVYYKYKNDETNTPQRVGLIAQDVQATLPEAVSAEDDEIKTLQVRYTETIPLLVKAIQELKGIVDTQATKIAELEAKLEGTA